MTLIPYQLLLFSMLSAGIHWLIARSEIAQPFWSRARGWLAKLLACPSCSGYWIGLGLAVMGVRPVNALASSGWVRTAMELGAAAVLGVVATPIVEGVLMWGLRASAIEQDTDLDVEQGTEDEHTGGDPDATIVAEGYPRHIGPAPTSTIDP